MAGYKWRLRFNRAVLSHPCRAPGHEVPRPQAHLRDATLDKGVHPKIVSELLGHSSVSITLDTYSHIIPGLGEVAALAMEDILQ